MIGRIQSAQSLYLPISTSYLTLDTMLPYVTDIGITIVTVTFR